MRNPREELRLVQDVQAALRSLRARTERLPEGQSARVMVETLPLDQVERKMQKEIDDLRDSIDRRQDR